MLNAQILHNSSINERNKIIVDAYRKLVEKPEGLDVPSAISKTINNFIDEFIEIKIAEDRQRLSGSILLDTNIERALTNTSNEYKKEIVPALRQVLDYRMESIESSQNIFEMFGATKLASANKISRFLSTKLGHLWEEFARISPYTVDTEKEFKIGIRGIDLIAKNIITNDIEHLQIKTQKNTLTGSQRERSVDELKIHKNPVFCACFENSAQWTFFENKGIKRVCGKAFWERIGIPYEIIMEVVHKLILGLEQEYVNAIY